MSLVFINGFLFIMYNPLSLPSLQYVQQWKHEIFISPPCIVLAQILKKYSQNLDSSGELHKIIPAALRQQEYPTAVRHECLDDKGFVI
jgi:hypothetical protein